MYLKLKLKNWWQILRSNFIAFCIALRRIRDEILADDPCPRCMILQEALENERDRVNLFIKTILNIEQDKTTDNSEELKVENTRFWGEQKRRMQVRAIREYDQFIAGREARRDTGE